MTKFPLRQNFFLHCHRRRSMVRLIPLLKRVFFCPKIQREALGKLSPAYPRRPVYRTPCNPSVGAGFYPARSSALLVTDAGRCGHRPLRNPIGKHSVGADASVRPSIPYRTPCKNPVIAKPVRTLAVAIRIPRPQAPLPKGGCHGKAVTGGFFLRTSCTLRRAGCPHPAAPPHPMLHPVGATLAVAHSAALLVTPP